MRVLHLTSLYAPHSVGGAEQVVQLLAEGMAVKQIESIVVCLVPHAHPHFRLNGVDVMPLQHGNPLWIEDVPHYPGLVRNFSKIATLFNVLTAEDFRKLLEKVKPDVVHTHSMVSFPPWMWKIAKKSGAITVHTLHDYDLVCIRAALFKNNEVCKQRHLACLLFSNVKKTYHGYIDHVVGVSQSILEKHLELGFFQHLPFDKQHVVWNPVQALPQKNFRNSLVEGGVITFGFIGRLVAEKGILLLIEACHELPKKGWRLIVAGRPSANEESLSALAKGLPIEFIGYSKQEPFYKSIDVLVVPSIWAEPFGLTVVEAYAAGVPVLGTNIGGTAEIVGQVDPDWLIESGNKNSLSNKMIEMIINKNKLALKWENVEKILKKTNPANVIESYINIYNY